jgi:hypothetical protein
MVNASRKAGVIQRTNRSQTCGRALEFAADGPYAGTRIRLDGVFAYQFHMPAPDAPPFSQFESAHSRPSLESRS